MALEEGEMERKSGGVSRELGYKRVGVPVGGLSRWDTEEMRKRRWWSQEKQTPLVSTPTVNRLAPAAVDSLAHSAPALAEACPLAFGFESHPHASRSRRRHHVPCSAPLWLL